MSVSENSVGIDYHSEKVQVSVLSAEGVQLGNRCFPSDAGEVIKFVSRFGEVKEVALEACNGAASFADELSLRGGYRVKLAHPGYVQRLKRGLDKTDCSDAKLLGDLLRVGYLPEVWLAPMELRELRSVVRYRQQIVERRAKTKVRIRSLLRHFRICVPRGLSLWTRAGLFWLETSNELPASIGWITKRHVAELRSSATEILECEKLLRALTVKDVLIQELIKEKGIGLISAALLRAEIGRFDRFRNGKQLSCFCGLSPCNTSSGERVATSGMIRSGNKLLKAVLLQAAHCLLRYDEHWRSFAERLLAAGKPRCVVVAAVANRWMRTLFHKFRTVGVAA